MERFTLLSLVCAVLANPLSAQRLLPIGSGADVLGIYDMLVQDDRLIVGGLFANFNGHARRNLQGWDGTQHFDMPGAFESTPERVNALEIFDGELVVGGNDLDYNYIARWDGDAWSALGTGLTGRPLDLAVYFDGLCAGGQDSAVSFWDGVAWTVLGEFNGIVSALAVRNDVLYAGGNFTATADGVTALNGVARFNGSTWEQIATGLNGPVFDLLSTPNGLVVGGDFTGDMGGSLYPHWVIFNDDEFEVPTFDPGAPVTGTVAMPSGGFVLANTLRSTWLLQGNALPVAMGDIKAASFHNGQILVAGLGNNAEYPQTLNKIARLVPGRSTDVLDIGGIRATAFADPRLFHRRQENRAGFEAPKDSLMYSIYQAQLWMRGNANGIDHYAAPVGSGESDVVAYGPKADAYDALYDDRYRQVWKLDRQLILDHIQNFDEPLYDMPWPIATWPGNGDVGNGEPAQLAPYMDLDEDGSYDPEEGEYPLFRGDQAVYFVYHTLPDLAGTPGLPFDVHVMHYAYADAEVVDRYNTVYTNLKVINRGMDTYEDLRAGMRTDFDIGNYQDDFLACDSVLGLSYGYNADAVDEELFGAASYGTRVPAQGLVLLNRTMSAHGALAGVMSAAAVNDALDGTLIGQPFTGPGISTHFLYPGAPLSEEALGNAPGDRNGVASAGPFTLPPGDTLCLDVAFIFARSDDGPLASVDLLKDRAMAIRGAYLMEGLTCVAPNDFNVRVPASVEALPWALAPVPAEDHVFLSGPEARVIVLDGTGREVRQHWHQTGVSALDVSDLRSGVFFVRLLAEGSGTTLRLVKVER